jgi:signal transduction histidine kinase
MPSALPPAWPLDISDEELNRLETHQPGTDEQRLHLQLQLAWHWRQRDSQRSLALVEQAQQNPWPEPESARAAWLAARLHLLQAEHGWLQADLSAAQQLAESAGRSLQELGDLVGQVDAGLILAAVAIEGARIDDAQKHLQQAERCAEQAADAQRWAVCRGMQAYWSLDGDVAHSERLWGDEMAAQQQHADPLQAMWAWMYRGRVAMRRGNPAKAIQAHMRSAELAGQAGQVRRAIIICVNIGLAHKNLNDLAGALNWTQHALDLARPAGWSASVGACLTTMAGLLRELQRPAEARKMGLEARRLMQPLGRSRALALVEVFLAEMDVDEGALESAIAGYRQLLALQPPPEPSVTFNAWCGLGKALGLRGEGAPAQSALNRVLGMARDAGLAIAQFEALQLLGELHARLPLPPPPGLREASASLHYFNQALAVAETIAGHTVPAALWDRLAQAHAQAGDMAQAYGHSLRAAAARDQTKDQQARRRAIAMALQLETETAHAERQRLNEQARHTAQRTELLRANHTTLEQLNLIGQEITGQLDIATVFGRIHKHLRALVDVSHLAIWLLQPDGLTLNLRFGLEGDQRLAPNQVRLDDETSKVALCWHEQREVLYDSPPGVFDPAHMPGTRRTHTALFGPLQVRGRMVGVLSIQSARVNAYAERERLVFRALCAYGAIALDNAAAYEQLNQAQLALEQAGAGERQARLRAQEAIRLKNDFLFRVAQDLRLPLAQLHGSLQEAQRSANPMSPSAGRASLTAAMVRSREVNVLARELLELARLESGAVTLSFEPFSLADLAHDVLHKCADRLATKRQRVDTLLPADGCDVVADIGMIERVLTELLVQAATRSPEGGALRLQLLSQQDRIRVEVAGSGPPLADETAAELLLRHSRAGAGLGLVIARQMLQLHGQLLQLRSDGGEGLVMSFELMRAGA